MKENKEEELNKGLKLLVGSSFIVFIGLFLSKIFFYAYRLVIARFFGPEAYGVFSLALSLLLLFTLFFTFGFDRGVLRFISLYKEKEDKRKVRYLVSFSTKITFFSGILAAIILYFLAETISIKIFHNSDLVIFLKIFSFTIPLTIFSNILLSIIRAYEKIFWYSFFLNILQNVLKFSSLILLIFLGVKLNSVPISYSIGIFGMFLASYFFCRVYLSDIFGRHDLKLKEASKMKREFLAYSWPLMLFGVINTILFWIDSFSIGFFRNTSEVGLYNVAVPLAALLGFFPELFIQLFFPLITKEYSKKNIPLIKELSKQLGKWIFMLNLPLFIILFLFPGAIINILFGKEYILAENSLRILSLGTFVATSTIYISDNLLAMKGKSKLILANILIAAIINILLDIFLVPKYGINGAAIATAIVHILLGFAILFEAKYYSSIVPVRRKMFKILFISLIPTILLIFLRKIIPINLISIVLLGILFLFLYILLIFITNCLDKNDFMILKSIRRKYLLKQ